MLDDRFELEGKTYYQQWRKCNKTACHCQEPGDPGHGPYWYTRDDQGRRGYVGRDLPENVQRARATHDRRLPAMLAEARRLDALRGALNRLLTNQALRDGDREIIAALGFGDCLVLSPARGQTQDAGLVPSGELQATQDGDRGLVPGRGQAHTQDTPGSL